MNIIKPPVPIPSNNRFKIFLAGSIEMGAAEDWQTKFTNEFKGLDIVFLNPRRDSWDISWEQTMENQEFRTQVEWELSGMDLADLIVMYLDPATKSPVSLLELGLFARSGKLAVCCPKGFWRRGNVEIVCKRYQVPFFEEIKDLVGWVNNHLK